MDIERTDLANDDFKARTSFINDEKTERQLLLQAKYYRLSEIAKEISRLTHENELLSLEIYNLECEDRM